MSRNKRKRNEVEDVICDEVINIKKAKTTSVWDTLLNIVEYDGINNWVSGTAIRNYLLGDPIIDWLELNYTKLGYKQNEMDDKKTKLNVLFKQGTIFESAVLQDIEAKYPNDYVQVAYSREDENREKFDETLKHMNNHKPIISQAVLYNDVNKTFGMADLLVRSDYVSKLISNRVLSGYELGRGAPFINCRYHYIVIDIKWSSLHLCSDGEHVRNSDRYPAYKGQLAIYNSILGTIQGYYPPKAYILGHSWKFETCKEIVKGYNCFDRLGHIDYTDLDTDSKYIELTKDAIMWIRRVRKYGETWSVYPPSVRELYPNMSNYNDSPWSSIKKDIAVKNRELTLLWMVGKKNRNTGHDNGIIRWDDAGCTSKSLGINGKKIGPILDKILEINGSGNNAIVDPPIINVNSCSDGWHKSEPDIEYTIDFETVNACFLSSPTNIKFSKTESNIIFMIGLGYYDAHGGDWRYIHFTVDRMTLCEEKRIISELIEFLSSRTDGYRKKPKLFHWCNAEKTSINIANNRNNQIWTDWIDNKVSWIDMHKVFMQIPIVIKGALKFKLKDVAKAMYDNGLITTTWMKNGINDGLDAMIEAINYYENPQKYAGVLKDIIDYNEIDCKVILDIVHYLRDNHVACVI